MAEDAANVHNDGAEYFQPSIEASNTGDWKAAAAPVAPATAGTIIAGKYKLLQQIGEGGMGTIWMADQTAPVKRRVAVKLIRVDRVTSQTILARFEAERQAIAMMDHPHIAKLLDAGTTDSDAPFFVMELVKGIPLTAYCDKHKLNIPQRLLLFTQICSAVQHAHQKGIIHRDLKPSNILVESHDDKPVPKVIDFGLAKATNGVPLTENTLFTGFEAVVGTLLYMAPEQASFNALDVDTRADIYALGVILYELLTGTTPITRETMKTVARDEMMRIIREQEAPTPSTRLSSLDAKPSIAAIRGMEPAKLSKEFRGELDWIAMKALEKDRARRYETANALARDVQRYLSDEVVEARPPSMGYRVKKFVRRHKGQVVAASLIFLALIGGAIGAAYGVIEAGNQRIANSLREQAEIARDAAEVARGEAVAAREGETQAKIVAESARDDLAREREKLARVEYGRTMQVTYEQWRDNNIVAARTLLDGTRKDLRGWEWHYVHRLCHSELLTLKGHTHIVVSASFSPDGTRIVIGSWDKTARVWDARSGAELLSLKGHTEQVSSASFSPDGTRIVTGSWDKTARVWDARSGAEVLSLKGHTSIVRSASFSPDGTRIATGSEDNTARVWDARSGAEVLTLKGHTSGVSSTSFSPDGTRIVTGSIDNTARVWDARSGAELLSLKGHTSGVSSTSFSPDGTRIVTASIDKTARVWDARPVSREFLPRELAPPPRGR